MKDFRFAGIFSWLFLVVVVAHAQWVQVNGSDGGVGGGILAFASLDSVLFVGTYGDGIFISTDNGENWNSANNGLTGYCIASLTVVSKSVYAGVSDVGFFVSDDYGRSWHAVNSALQNQPVGSVVVTDTTFYTLTTGDYFNIGNNIYRSTDSAKSWVSVLKTPFTPSALRGIAVNANVMYVGTWHYRWGTGRGVFRSTDNGVSWRNVNSGLTDTNIISIAMHNDNVFVATSISGIYRSTNNDTTWTPINTGLPSLNIYSFTICGDTLFTSTDSGICCSIDDGISWNMLLRSDLFVNTFMVKGSRVFLGSDRFGILYSDNNRIDWVGTNNGLSNTRIETLFADGSRIFVSTSYAGNYSSDNNGASWSKLSNMDPILCFAASSDTVLAGTWDSLFLSTDKAKSWLSVYSFGIDNRLIRGGLAINKGKFFVAGHSGIYVSDDGGTKWDTLSSELLTSVDALAIIEGNLIAGTPNGLVLSEDDGATWKLVDSGIKVSSYMGLVVNKYAVFAPTFDQGVYRTVDNGRSWSAVDMGIDNSSNKIMATCDSIVFASTLDGHIFISEDNGTNWRTCDSGLSGVTVISLAAADNYLFAGTSERGVWRRPVSELVKVRHNRSQQHIAQPLNCSIRTLHGSEHTLSIQFALNNQEQTNVLVHDLTGRTVATIVDKQHGAGSYTYRWNYSKCAPGCYTVVIRSGNRIYSKNIPMFK